MHHQSHSAVQEHIHRSLCPTVTTKQITPLYPKQEVWLCTFCRLHLCYKASRVLWLPVADFSSLCNTEASLPHLSCRRLWFFFQRILRSVRDIQGMKQSFTPDYKPAATSLSQRVSGFSTQTHNSVGTKHNADKHWAYHHSVHAETNNFQTKGCSNSLDGSPHILELHSMSPAGKKTTGLGSWDGTTALRHCKLYTGRREEKGVVVKRVRERHKIIRGRVLCRVPPGCVAPNDWSICSIVGAMAWELKWTPLKTHTHTQSVLCLLTFKQDVLHYWGSCHKDVSRFHWTRV